MSPRRLLVYLALLALVGGFYYVYEYKGAPKREEAKQEASSLLHLQEGQLARLTVTQGESAYTLQKVGDTWRVTAPLDWPADASVVGKMVSALVRATTDEVAAEGNPDWAEFGLDHPRLVLTLGPAAQPEQKLELGNDAPAGPYMFARLNGQDKVLVTSFGLYGELARPLFDVRDKRLLALDQAQVKQIRFDSPEGSLALAKTGDEQWEINEPIKTTADRAEVEKLLFAAEDLQAKEFVADQPASLVPYGLDQPRQMITFVSGEEQLTQTLVIGNHQEGEKPGTLIRTLASNTVCRVDDVTMEKLRPGLFALRDKQLVGVPSYRVNRLETESAGKTLTLAKSSDNDWRFDGAAGARADEQAVNDALTKLTGARAVIFESLPGGRAAELGLSPPRAVLRLYTEEGQEPVVVEIGKEKAAGETCYARRAGTDWAMVVRTRDLALLDANAEELRDRSLFHLGPAEAGELTLAGAGKELHLTRQALGGWEVKTGGPKLEADKVEEACSTLLAARVAEFVPGAGADLAAAGLDAPLLTVTVEAQGDGLTETVRFGHKEGETSTRRYALSSEGTACLVEQSGVEAALDVLAQVKGDQ